MKFKDFLNKIISKKNFSKYTLLCGLAGISLIFASSFLKPETKSLEVKNENKFISEQKREKLEKNLETIVSKIKGADRKSVV